MYRQLQTMNYIYGQLQTMNYMYRQLQTISSMSIISIDSYKLLIICIGNLLWCSCMSYSYDYTVKYIHGMSSRFETRTTDACTYTYICIHFKCTHTHTHTHSHTHLKHRCVIDTHAFQIQYTCISKSRTHARTHTRQDTLFLLSTITTT